MPVLAVETSAHIQGVAQCPAHIHGVFDAIGRYSALGGAIIIDAISSSVCDDYGSGPGFTLVVALREQDGAVTFWVVGAVSIELGPTQPYGAL